MENNVFTYRYSATQNKEVERIRKKYLPREQSKLEELKRLDGRVQSAGLLQSLSLGVLGALVFGVGLSFGLGALSGAAWLAPTLGAMGTVMMIPAYPVYKHIARKTREMLTPEILRLSDEIMKS
ncbi:MAG: hypothetical protein IJW97_06765 [Clostridia bacterium]|nr:hypothetical protein [Clostridia bacterium]